MKKVGFLKRPSKAVKQINFFSININEKGLLPSLVSALFRNKHL